MELKTITDTLKNFLYEDGVLRAFPAKFKMKIYALYYLASKFESGRIYGEREVNELLGRWSGFGDSAMLRRELYNKRFLNRKSDCSEYWLEEKTPELSDFKLEYWVLSTCIHAAIFVLPPPVKHPRFPFIARLTCFAFPSTIWEADCRYTVTTIGM